MKALQKMRNELKYVFVIIFITIIYRYRNQADDLYDYVMMSRYENLFFISNLYALNKKKLGLA